MRKPKVQCSEWNLLVKKTLYVYFQNVTTNTADNSYRQTDMKYLRTFGFLLMLVVFFDNCVPDENDVGIVAEDPTTRKSEKFYSPDKRCYVTIYEVVFDSTETKTHLVMTFEKTSVKTGAGIYSVQGIHKDIKVSWADNSTLVIETKKEYVSRQKLDHVQSFDDEININYTYK